MGFLKPKTYKPDPEVEEAVRKQREEEERCASKKK